MHYYFWISSTSGTELKSEDGTFIGSLLNTKLDDFGGKGICEGETACLAVQGSVPDNRRENLTEFCGILEENNELREEIANLKKKLASSAQPGRFGIERLAADDAQLRGYTGLPSYDVFKCLYSYLEPRIGRI